jgi:hypothetical protein
MRSADACRTPSRGERRGGANSAARPHLQQLVVANAAVDHGRGRLVAQLRGGAAAPDVERQLLQRSTSVGGPAGGQRQRGAVRVPAGAQVHHQLQRGLIARRLLPQRSEPLRALARRQIGQLGQQRLHGRRHGRHVVGDVYYVLLSDRRLDR